MCGLAQAEGHVLELKRRPLLRDELAYFFSLCALMYIINDGLVHTWEAALLLVLYIIYLLVIVFSHSIRVWFIHEVMGGQYISHTRGIHGHEEQLLEENIYDDEEYGAHEDYANVWGPPVYVSFKKRPLGFKVEPGEGRNSAIVSWIETEGDEDHFVETGSQVMEIAGKACTNLSFDEIQDLLDREKLPLIIKFQTPPKDTVVTWSNARVKQWWSRGLPPACQQYIHIVDECQLDGSDLLDLDWEMLAEFGVKKIHGMKILKAIKNLMGSRQLLGTEVQRVVKQLEKWEVTPHLVSELKQDILGKFDGSVGQGTAAGSEGSGSESEDHGVLGSLWEILATPLEFIFKYTAPECEYGTPNQNLWPVTFLVSFLWVSIFSFLLSSIVERWVELTHVPMAFFGLLLVSVAAQIPDTLESLAVAKKGYGSMAVSNCLGTQTINIGIGLGLPWLITASTGAVIELDHKLLESSFFMLGLIIATLIVYMSDVVIFGRNKVILGRVKSWILVILYFICIGGYAIVLVANNEM